MPSREVPRLIGPRLIVTLPRVDQAQSVVDYWRKNAERFARTDPPRPAGWDTVEFWRTQLEKNRTEHAAGTSLKMYALLRGDPGEPVIGQVTVSQIFRGPFQSCMLGYGIDGDHEGKGMMYEAVSITLDHLFGTLGLHRVQANHLPSNLRSAQLLRRLGFVVEGYARNYLFIDGEWRDHVLCALINPEPSPPLI